MMQTLLFMALVLVMGTAANAAGRFDWDRYHDRQDACVLYDQTLRECSARGDCDETVLRLLRRQCSAFWH